MILSPAGEEWRLSGEVARTGLFVKWGCTTPDRSSVQACACLLECSLLDITAIFRLIINNSQQPDLIFIGASWDRPTSPRRIGVRVRLRVVLTEFACKGEYGEENYFAWKGRNSLICCTQWSFDTSFPSFSSSITSSFLLTLLRLLLLFLSRRRGWVETVLLKHSPAVSSSAGQPLSSPPSELLPIKWLISLLWKSSGLWLTLQLVYKVMSLP